MFYIVDNMDEDEPLQPQPWRYTGLRALACLLLCWGFLAGSSALSIGPTTVLAVLTLLSLFVSYELMVRGVAMAWITGAIFILLGAGAAGYGLWHVTRPPEAVGPLLPANEPAPQTACRDSIGPHDLVMVAAESRVVGKGEGPFRMLTVGDCPVLRLARKGRGLMVDATFYDWTNDIAFRVADNVFEPFMPLQLRQYRPDPHTLVILDRFDQEVLYLRYLNPHALRLRGRFLCGEQPQAVIRDHAVLMGGVRIGGVFFGQHRRPGGACAVAGPGQPGLTLGGG
jgi:hypothetical protein